MAEINFPPLGQGIQVYSAVHKANALVVATMDNVSYPPGDYDWNAMYSVFPTFDSPIPAPYAGHKGTDVTVGKGAPLYALVSGTVKETGGTYNWVIVEADDGYTYRYLHNDTVVVSSGQRIEAGQQFGTEGGYGASGPSTYASHNHTDRFETATGKIVDAFNVIVGGSSGGATPPSASANTVLVKTLTDWKGESGKVGIWLGGLVRVQAGAEIYQGPEGERTIMRRENGEEVDAHVWRGEFGSSMLTTPCFLSQTRMQVAIYDQLGAFHPRAWVECTAIE